MKADKTFKSSLFANPISFSTFEHEDETINQNKGLLDREILISILDSLACGIQVVDINGNIKYVNNKFLSIVGVNKEDRLGKNIFDVSYDGSISGVLKTGKPIHNLRNFPKGSSVELVSSASPIFLDGNIIGAVAVVNDVKDVFVLSEQLKESKNLVKNLSERISYLAKPKYSIDDIIGNCEQMQKVKELVILSAQNESTVLILGETGTGKELIAESIHNFSLRSKNPFIGINCSAIPENLLESEFFGYEKGSFTGALKTKLGKFELANGGTLFLDEIGDMDLKLQSKILKAIEEKAIQRIGGDSTISLDIRIIAATNRDLRKMVSQGLFRQDLFYRLNVLTINLPPLRERTDDIEELCEFMINKISRKVGRKGITISQDAIDVLKGYSWPGNVRELENLLERVIISCKNWQQISARDLNITISDDDCGNISKLRVMNLKQAEKTIISEALKKYGLTYSGKQEAASALGISIATLYNKLKEYNI